MINMLVNMYPRGGVRDEVGLHMFYASCFTDVSSLLLARAIYHTLTVG